MRDERPDLLGASIRQDLSSERDGPAGVDQVVNQDRDLQRSESTVSFLADVVDGRKGRPCP